MKGEGEGRNGENGMERRRKAEGLRVKGEGEGRKTAPPMPPPGLTEERGGRREKDGPSYALPPPQKKKKKKILGTQIFLSQLNGVWAPLCKGKRF